MEGLTVRKNIAEFGNSFGEYLVNNFDVPLLFDNGTLLEPMVDISHFMTVASATFEENKVNQGSSLLKVTEGSLSISNSAFSDNKATNGTDCISMEHI